VRQGRQTNGMMRFTICRTRARLRVLQMERIGV
jgi:hypothetical protein